MNLIGYATAAASSDFAIRTGEGMDLEIYHFHFKVDAFQSKLDTLVIRLNIFEIRAHVFQIKPGALYEAKDESLV